MKTILGLAVLMLFAVPVKAQATAGKVAAVCETSAATIGNLKEAGANEGYCTGLFVGWREVIDELPVFTLDRKSQIHISETATIAQLIRVFVNYVKKHPEVENKNAFVIFLRALKGAGLAEGKW
jgi:Rap1a immunity proteins